MAKYWNNVFSTMKTNKVGRYEWSDQRNRWYYKGLKANSRGSYTDIFTGEKKQNRDLRTANRNKRIGSEISQKEQMTRQREAFARIEANRDKQKAEELAQLIAEANALGVDFKDMEVSVGGWYVYDDAMMGKLASELAKATQEYEEQRAQELVQYGIDPDKINFTDGTTYGERLAEDSGEQYKSSDRLRISLEKLAKDYRE